MACPIDAVSDCCIQQILIHVQIETPGSGIVSIHVHKMASKNRKCIPPNLHQFFLLCTKNFKIINIMQVTYFSGQIFENGCAIYCSCGSNTAVTCGSVFQMPVDTTDWKLKLRMKHVKNLTEMQTGQIMQIDDMNMV